MPSVGHLARKQVDTTLGESYIDFMYEALKVSTIAPAMKTLYESIKDNAIARISLNDLPLELQLPPFLDSLLHADEDVSPEAYEDDGEPSAWSPTMSFAWRLPTLTPWKALLRLDDDDDVVAREERVAEQLAHEHAVGDILDARVARGRLVEAHRVPDARADGGLLLFGDACGERGCGDLARLGDGDHAVFCEPCFEEILRHLWRRLGRRR